MLKINRYKTTRFKTNRHKHLGGKQADSTKRPRKEREFHCLRSHRKIKSSEKAGAFSNRSRDVLRRQARCRALDPPARSNRQCRHFFNIKFILFSKIIWRATMAYTARARHRRMNTRSSYTKYTDSVHGKLASTKTAKEINAMFREARLRRGIT